MECPARLEYPADWDEAWAAQALALEALSRVMAATLRHQTGIPKEGLLLLACQWLACGPGGAPARAFEVLLVAA